MKIICLGDSITANEESPTYVNFWQELADAKMGQGKTEILCAGVNGETAQDGYYRVDRDVLPHKPDIVTVMFGHNDVSLNVLPKTYQRYLDQIITRLQAVHIKDVWLLSPNQVWGQDNQTPYGPYLETLTPLAQEKSVRFIDMWRHAFVDHSLDDIYTEQFNYAGLTGRDYIHPNALGHQLMAKLLMIQLGEMV